MEKLPKEKQRELERLWNSFRETLVKGGVNDADIEVYTEQGRNPVLGRSDGGLMFENRLPALFDGLDRAKMQATVPLARKALGRFLNGLEVREPWPYYAILVADGDRMGRAIERQETAQRHRDLSRALDAFAQRVSGIVEGEHRGELIYAGGDDVLAFVPLHRVLSCAEALRTAFLKELAGFPTGETGGAPTLSVGIGICHFFDLMSRALDVARRAEKLAKVERDSLAVIVDKRSGPAVEAWGRWGTIDQDLAKFVEMHRHDWVPDGAAYELRELARLLEGAAEKDRESLEDLVDKEAERILRRKQPKRGDEAALSESCLGRLLEALRRKEPAASRPDLPASSGLARLADRLILARTFARAAEEAKPPSGGAA
jgi:CRISPR-associated protein Cmr2